MKYDTAGNPIIEIIPNCSCGLTGGCEKCNPSLAEGGGTKDKVNVLIRQNRKNLWCKKCHQELKNGISKYCLGCRREMDKLKRK